MLGPTGQGKVSDRQFLRGVGIPKGSSTKCELEPKIRLKGVVDG